MKLLAFEASTRRLSVALWQEGKVTEIAAEVKNGGSEWLLPWADDLLRQHGLRVRDLDGLAFGAGPGAFTGLRLACGIAQGLALALALPVAPVGTLAALAYGAKKTRVLACLDARMGEVYVAAYEIVAGCMQEMLPPRVGAPETVDLPAGEGWLGVGDGFASHGEILAARLGRRLSERRPEMLPTAAAVAELGHLMLTRGEGVLATHALPFYVRDKVALTVSERLAQGGSK
ncbi:MAG: tRNA (adenosine(37)-N6)-threonylcarbamoyltransferase complex dimerization subunit type 1 TsaB [Rhodocyclaceae bacterium]|nr:tRNA (adenosine(37)-N6)-threonylcarbamoyltransferase complex dimerization subunit type 1 TsaB [Rhodocyclaceae bacterium]